MTEAVSRRSLLAAAAGWSIGLLPDVAAGEPADSYTNLVLLRQRHDAIMARREAVWALRETILAAAPPRDLSLSEVLKEGAGYSSAELATRIGSESELRDWFRAREHSEDDLERAINLICERQHARDRHFEEHGAYQLLDEDEALYSDMDKVRQQIIAVPCRSMRDLAFKAAFAVHWLADDDCHYADLIAILKSMVPGNGDPDGMREGT